MAQAAEGFTVIDLYHFPIHIRNFYYNKIVESKKQEKKEMDKIKQESKSKVRIKR